MFFYRRSLSMRGCALILLTLVLFVGGCTLPQPDPGPTGQEVAPTESGSLIPIPPQPPVAPSDQQPSPGIVLTTEAARQQAFVIGVGLERMLDDDETLYEDALVPGIQLAIRQINELGFIGEGRQMVLIAEGAALPADPTALAIPEQAALDNIVASLGPLLPYANVEEAALPLVLRPDTGTDVFGIDQYVDNWTYQPDFVSSELTLQTILMARDYLTLNNVALISADVIGADTELFVQELQAQGMEVVAAVTLAEGLSPTDLLLQVGEVNPNAVVLNVPVAVAADILIAAQDFEFPTPTYFIGGAGVVGPALLDLAGDAAHGIFGGVDWLLVHPFAVDEGFVEAFRTAYGMDPDTTGAKGYAAIWLLAEAMRTTDIHDSAAVRVALANLTQVETPFGVFTMDAAPPGSALLLYVNEMGEIVVVGE
ncbi:MAG: ABC transporter substrate-binding protein [Caldilineaceae bacterium]|nr:ABC transporter substrate-binding protein [Caldilineaceae bacterium]